MNLPCPACGAEVLFKSKYSFYCVCPYCRSMLVRHDESIENLGKMSEFPQDTSPLQIGTIGTYEHVGFSILGRQRVRWTDGAWNEWYLNFEDGKDGWLGDAQGFYMVSFEVRDITQIPPRSSIQVEAAVQLGKEKFIVEDIKDISCVFSEGELPLKSVQGRKSTSVDLIGSDKSFANIDYGADVDRAFIGKYVEVEDLNLLNLRQIDGW